MKISTILIALGILIPTTMYLVNPFSTATWDPRAGILGIIPYSIPSTSMAPTLVPGDFVLVNATAYMSDTPEINDVIVFKYPKNREINYVKRVLARGGETVVLKNGKVSVNGKSIKQYYVEPNSNIRTSTIEKAWEVPPGSLFVLGDNRDNANDSRYWGYVPVEDVVGKVTLIWMSDDSDRIGQDVE